MQQHDFLLIGPPGRDDFARAEQIEHRRLADGARLPGRHNRRDLRRRHARHAEIRVQRSQHQVRPDVVRNRLRRVPPINPAQNLRQRRADAQGNRVQDAVLAALAQLDGRGRLPHPLLGFQHPRAQHGHHLLFAVHRPLKSRQPLARELQIARRGPGRLRLPGRAAANPQRRILVEAADIGRRQRRVMHPVKIIRIDAVMVQVGRNDVRQRNLVHVRQRMARPVKHKRNQRQRLAQAQRRQGVHQLPFLFAPAPRALHALVLGEELPDFHLIRPIRAADIRRPLRRHQLADAQLRNFNRHKRILRVIQRRFLQHQQRQHIPALHPFRPPVDDVFRRVSHRISAFFPGLAGGAAAPIHQRARPAHIDDLRDELLREGGKRSAQHVRILHKFHQDIGDAADFRQLESRITAENQTHETIRRPRRGIVEQGAVLIGGVILVILRIQPAQILFALGLHRILAREDIARPQPAGEARVIFKMCAVYRHCARASPAWVLLTCNLQPSTHRAGTRRLYHGFFSRIFAAKIN